MKLFLGKYNYLPLVVVTQPPLFPIVGDSIRLVYGTGELQES